jgi:tight adherence protein C
VTVNLITIGIFVFVMSLVWLLGRVLLRPHATAMVAPMSGRGPARIADGDTDHSSAFVASLAAQFPQTLLGGEELEKDFRRAGYYRTIERHRYFALRNGIVILIVFATAGAAVAIGPQHERAAIWTLSAGLLAAIIGFSVPRLLLAVSARQRVERIRTALPDAMDTIGMCLHGGISLQECLGYVGQEMMYVHPDLALELLIVGQQADVNSFEFAIQQFATRIDAPEVVALAAMVTQNQKLGASVIESIREFADSLRLKRRQMAEAKASRAELFLLFPVVFCLVPSILILLWGPPILSLIEFAQGHVIPTKIMP